MKLIKNIEVYAPEYMGKKDVFLAGSKIEKIADEITLETSMEVDVVDGEGMLLFPGFIDSHVHITGGGGEGGFSTRTPEIMLSDITKGGVTTVIGTLGTDGTTRTMTNLLAKACGLEEEGITTFINTGSYQIPIKTMTDSITNDIILINKVIGVGEVALADHRSSAPTAVELARIVTEARLGGMLSGKAGTVNIHMGDSRQMLGLVEEVVEKTDIPMKHFVPTHMNRNPYLFEKAKEYAKKGGYIDFTTSTVPLFIEEGEVPAYHTLKLLEESGAPLDGVTFSSDGQGSLPIFDEKGEMTGIEVGKVTSLYESVKDAILLDSMDIEKAISVITRNPAKVYELKGKGKVAEKADADLVMVDKETLEIQNVIAKGVDMVRNRDVIKKGTYEC